MKTKILLLTFIVCISSAFGQSKKEIIETLNIRIDSLNIEINKRDIKHEQEIISYSKHNETLLSQIRKQENDVQFAKSVIDSIQIINNKLYENNINLQKELRILNDSISKLNIDILSSSGYDKIEFSVDGRGSTDTIAELLNQLKNIPLKDNYILNGGLKTDILKFKSVAFGDILHFGFVDINNNEYNFAGNITKIELETDATNPEDEDGYEANKRYVNKNFRVVWRTIKLKNEPKDVYEMYYEEYDEIIYLKQIN